MKTRIMALSLLMVILSCVLAGCACEHEWKEATCLTPKTCTLCQTTEGEALGHSWIDATCAVPKTCATCGETEGEPRPHTWVEANYQDPKICTGCDTTEGEPLIADFEKYGIETMKLEEGKVYDYVTTCYDNTQKKTVGELKVREYITASKPYNLPYKEGYEWKLVYFDITFSDANAWKYGWNTSYCMENYYEIEEWDNSRVELADGDSDFSVNYNGSSREVAFKVINSFNSGWNNKVIHYYLDIAFQVPEGYDGVVFGFHDAAMEWKDDTHIYDIADENTLLFRLD